MATDIRPLFDYGAIDEVARDDVRDAAVRIKVRMARAAQDIIEIGKDLIAVKAALGHGQFMRWIEAEFDWSDRSADRFMQVARRFGSDSPNLSNLSFHALAVLSAPSTPDEVVAEVVERTEGGETFTAADIKAMKEEWDEERRELKRLVQDQKDKTKDAKATEKDASEYVKSLQDEIAALRDQCDTLRVERQHMASRGVAPDPLNSLEVKEKQVEALMAAWNKAGADAREEFLARVDRPAFDNTRSGRAA